MDHYACNFILSVDISAWIKQEVSYDKSNCRMSCNKHKRSVCVCHVFVWFLLWCCLVVIWGEVMSTAVLRSNSSWFEAFSKNLAYIWAYKRGWADRTGHLCLTEWSTSGAAEYPPSLPFSFESPKSINLMCFSASVSMMFDKCRSLCTIPWLWIYSKPLTICMSHEGQWSRRTRSSQQASVRPATHSIANCNWSVCEKKSRSITSSVRSTKTLGRKIVAQSCRYCQIIQFDSTRLVCCYRLCIGTRVHQPSKHLEPRRAESVCYGDLAWPAASPHGRRLYDLDWLTVVLSKPRFVCSDDL